LLSDHVARSGLMGKWLEADGYEDLGVLFGRLRPTHSSPTLEFSVPWVVYCAWHFDRLPGLLSAAGSQLPLLAVLPSPLRVMLELGLGLPVQPLPDLADLPATFADVAMSAFLTPLMLDWLSSSSERLSDADLPKEWVKAVDSQLVPGVYQWLASRRSPQRLLALAERMPGLIERMPVLACNTAREAVARMSESERSFIRGLLMRLHDDAGLGELGLA
jgi:hypothetical protein